jgi:hypothetical protein
MNYTRSTLRYPGFRFRRDHRPRRAAHSTLQRFRSVDLAGAVGRRKRWGSTRLAIFCPIAFNFSSIRHLGFRTIIYYKFQGGRRLSARVRCRSERNMFYPIDWPQLSTMIRFVRAKGRCEECGRPHGHEIKHLGDGRWWDEYGRTWRDGSGTPFTLSRVA